MSPFAAAANDIVGNHALEEVDDARKRRRRLVARRRRAPPAARPRSRAAAGTARVSSRIIDRAEHRRERADDDDPQHRTAGDPPAARRLRALGDADDQQRHDERDDGHLERVQPQACRRTPAVAETPARIGAARPPANTPASKADDERRKRPIGAEARRPPCSPSALAGLRSTRLPELEDEAVGLAADLRDRTPAGCDRRPGCAACRCSPTSSKPARLKSAFTTFGSIR